MKKILIVEDQPHIARILNDVLARNGFDTYVASNGENGVAKARSLKPDLILMDVMMPIKSGFDAAREIQEFGGLEDCRLIFLTAAEQETDRQQAAELGATEFITKPFSPREVLHKVQSLLA
ncbi:MAG: response regulator [Leptospiraceae bacterium]|nr:response regulator [Leptospiraceae bacterium]MCB1321741.1 response regulator [Leptospiraceae bacterium]